MIEVTATKLRNNLFEFLAQISKGEIIVIQRNGENVALMVPPKKEDWRNKIRSKIKFLTPPSLAFKPLEDVWEDYQ
ncbi:MAG: type II toxin-antitoxin system prevent-host-death family antitoxin [Acidobacteria bacterium]|jgi:prevent-host-death family protein|nr:type II toxin-antitoxin system prevent-host-death family antitoxin [Acidobacteriota bacterium]